MAVVQRSWIVRRRLLIGHVVGPTGPPALSGFPLRQRALLVHRRQDLPVFDEFFRAFWRERRRPSHELRPWAASDRSAGRKPCSPAWRPRKRRTTIRWSTTTSGPDRLRRPATARRTHCGRRTSRNSPTTSCAKRGGSWQGCGGISVEPAARGAWLRAADPRHAGRAPPHRRFSSGPQHQQPRGARTTPRLIAAR